MTIRPLDELRILYRYAGSTNVTRLYDRMMELSRQLGFGRDYGLALREASTMTDHENMARRVADCLEEHLHEYGWEPYRYRPSTAHPEGENKGVDADFYAGYSTVHLTGADGSSYALTLAQRTAPTNQPGASNAKHLDGQPADTEDRHNAARDSRKGRDAQR